MRKSLQLLAVFVVLAGCKKQPEIDYSPLDQAGMWTTTLEQVKKLNLSTAEITQLAALKRAGANDGLCLALLQAARDHHHEFTSGNSTVTLSRAGYTDAQILEMAQADKLDMLSEDAVMLKLLGLSGPTVQMVIQRREQGLPTLTSEQIGRLKNIGKSEKQIVEIINEGLPYQEAETKIARLEASRNHAHTDFVHMRGRR